MLAYDTPTETNDRWRTHRARQPRQPLAPKAIGALALVGVVAFGIDAVRGDRPPEVAPVAPTTPVAAAAPVDTAPLVDLEGCTLDVQSVTLGDSGSEVECVQKALIVSGHFTGAADAVFSDAVKDAVLRFQSERGLYVDGVVGRRTAEQLGIWPGDETFIVRTPPPAPGTYDSTGYELSSVASAGDDAPPLPEGADAVSGKRVVYSRLAQRVWAIDDDERIVRSYLVSGSQFNNELPGVHKVYSKTEMATGWNFQADLPLMVRYLDTDRGAIGFHQIPIHKADGTTYQTEAELGTRLSGGCQRQAPLDAIFMWNFAEIGTPVIVI